MQKKRMQNKRIQIKPILNANCDVLRDLVPFVQFIKREKHPWGSVTFSKTD